MKIDKRQFTKTEPRVNSLDMRGPLFIAGYSENYSPPYLSVRSKDFLRGSIRSLRINNKQVDWLTPRNSGLEAATPEFHRYSSETIPNSFRQFPSSAAAATTNRTYETKTFTKSSTGRKFL
jgi:hypothetical protein